MEPGDRLRAKRREAGLSARQLSERVGISESAVRNQENGTNGIKADLADVYARVLRTTPEWLLFGRDEAHDGPTSETVPVVGYVSAGAALALFDEGQGPFDYVPPPRDAKPTTVAARVQGTSLGPLFDEAIIFYDNVQREVTPDLHGRLCVAGLDDGRVVVKQLMPGDGGRYHLLSNSAEPPIFNAHVVWAARVTDVRPR